ncbi:PAS domain-containing sensor histidine kinase [Costertonia aggregata]|uniref:histidine kinase n=1 Tax=Costertonia aggregata TaxID=343403 RepID=A0A7H9AST5_9FLAO|nr:ATP-binding protein [Costertonia aggregata]QLG46541.1 PAS domain-containing protein [Costertonia aggregata]
MKSPKKKLIIGEDKISRKKIKEQVKKSQADLIAKIDTLDAERTFARRVLDQSNSVISLFRPIVDQAGEITDFTIHYVNNRMNEATKEDVDAIIGKRMSEYYPDNFENGVFEELVGCHETGKPKEFQRKYTFNEIDFWFSSRAVKLDDDVLVFSKNITKEKEFEIELDVQNKLLSEAEYVANIGSYKWNLGEDEIQYSANAFRLFGYEPNEFEPTVSKFMSFVHPDDLPVLEANYEEIMKRKERTEATYRIITKDKKIKTIRSVGEFYRKEGQWNMVGVLLDVTEQVAAERHLRSRNLELKRTNEELESFNRVASHDLQEPLRKIQMFISRLSGEATQRLEKREKEYLEKVVDSADRMRELIANLLSYSRIDQVEDKPKKVDLNSVLADVKYDLSERIAEFGAEIRSDNLPKVWGIEFQLYQLFSNLIGNSLKYSGTEQPPKITLSSKVVPYKEIGEGLDLTPSRYLVLDFKDNGIGFKKEHSDKIFEIFQRLHSKNEYSGTGLGLAICQKIVRAHNGAIRATGKLGKGATFTVYLPSLN